MPGGFLDRLGLGPEEVEARSRRRASELIGDRWSGAEAALAASVVYAAGDPTLVADVHLTGSPVLRARAALAAGRGLLVDVAMVAAGLRLRPDVKLGISTRVPGTEAIARRCGTTRAAAGIKEGWDEYGAGGVVAIGNAPTALLAVLDLAQHCAPPACVIATCPGLHVAAEAKRALQETTLPHVVVDGTRGGSGLAVAAVNFLLDTP